MPESGKKRTQYHDITEYRGIGDCFYSPPTSFSSSSMALSSCWSLPLSITPGIFLTLIIGSVWLFSIHSPDIFLALTGTTPQNVPSGNPSHPAQLQVPGTGIPPLYLSPVRCRRWHSSGHRSTYFH